ncbi:MAG: hypothetical protein KGQ57_00165 [Burkholderiales bacterium]|nr:hypothetical protein [Burkholderiales bacterium]
MASSAGFISRFLADVFPGRPANPQPAPSNSSAPEHSAPREVGQGAANETHITIGDVPNLFVDEGDCVVQFAPKFDEQMLETQFGIKVLPELTPHWSQVATHHCPLREAIAKAIRGPSVRTTQQAPSIDPLEPVTSVIGDAATDTPRERRAAPATHGDSDVMAAVTGTIISWGEEKFPRRKGSGPRFYESFAMRLDTATGERVLQGEGLKDAISESKCQVGDVVSVRRLRKIKVPAFHQSGEPKIVSGKQAMWDKWLWSISL